MSDVSKTRSGGDGRSLPSPPTGACKADGAFRRGREPMSWVLEATGVGLWFHALPFQELNWDERTRELFFVEAGKPATTELFFSRLHPEDRAPTERAIAAAIRDRTLYSIEHRAVDPRTGQCRWIRSAGRATYAADGTPLHFDGINFDITERRRAEEELRRANERLVEADRRKNVFLATLSHELRNPLAPIANSLWLLERGGLEGENASDAILILGRQVRQLSRLVDDLLDATRISRGKIRLRHEHLDLGELVRCTVDDHRALLADRGLQLEFEAPTATLPVHGDVTRLRQAVGNLLQNAAKYTAEGGLVTVGVRVSDDGGSALIRVGDTGIGMSAEVMKNLFQPFMQADESLDRSRGGLGLGLALVKGIIELHGGEVSARSAGPTLGSEFTIRLPLDGGRGERIQPVTAARSTDGRRVLIVEDNVDAAASLRLLLARAGHDAVVAHDGHSGLVRAREFRPEVILCDIGLPGMDGYELARVIRADEDLGATSLIALSGYAMPEDLEKAAEAGFDRHLAKPPNLDKLQALLAELPRG